MSSMNRTSASGRKALWIGLVALSLLLLIAGVLIGRYELLPVTRAITALKTLKKDVTVKVIGEDRYVRQELDKHYHAPTPVTAEAARSIDSSKLPLTLTKFPLAETGVFASSDDLVGGSLAIVEGSLLAMDKLGNFFVFKDERLQKLDLGRFPNGAAQSLLSSGEPLRMSALKALYFTYDPAHATIFASLQRFNAATGHARFAIASLPIDPKTLQRSGDWVTVFESEDIPDDVSFRGATGGRMIVAGDKLFFSVGDYNFGLVPEGQFGLVAQDKASAFGKIYEHDLNTHKTRVKSIGHRNPQGMVYTSSGRLIDAEHGPEGGDELNIVVDGNNYGWPYKTFGTDYGTFGWPIKFKPPAATFTPPMYSWVPSIAVSPLVQVSGFHDQWDGDLLAGSLKTQSLFRIRMIDDRVVFCEPIWVGHRIRDIVALPHRLVLMTDDPALVFVDVDEQRLKDNTKKQKNVEFSPVLAKCLGCHHFGDTNPSHVAPTLANIVNKPIGSDSYANYSEALKKKGGNWSEEQLARFLANPNAFAPGSAMPNPGLAEGQIREVISALGTRPKPQQ